MNFTEIINLSDGFFLLLLVVAGNFIAETLGCETQYYFSNNIYLKQLILFSLIYFTINFTSNTTPSPLESLKKTGLLWLFFLLFTKMSIRFTFVVLILLILTFVFEHQKKYIEATKKDNNEINQINNIQKILIIIILIITLIGFFRYYREKKLEYKGRFHFLKFISGVKRCKSLK